VRCCAVAPPPRAIGAPPRCDLYRSAPVDASVIVLAERLSDMDVGTTDRRQLHAVREARAFTLLPAI